MRSSTWSRSCLQNRSKLSRSPLVSDRDPVNAGVAISSGGHGRLRSCCLGGPAHRSGDPFSSSGATAVLGHCSTTVTLRDWCGATPAYSRCAGLGADGDEDFLAAFERFEGKAPDGPDQMLRRPDRLSDETTSSFVAGNSITGSRLSQRSTRLRRADFTEAAYPRIAAETRRPLRLYADTVIGRRGRGLGPDAGASKQRPQFGRGLSW